MVGAALLAGCADPSKPTAQETVLTKQWGDCIMDAVTRMDDGRSDPISVAVGVVGVCGTIYAALTEAAVDKFSTEGGQANMRALMKSNEIKGATSAVLIYRAHRSKDK